MEAKGDAVMRTPKTSSASPHMGGEGHCTAIQPTREEAEGVSGAILSCQLKISKAGASAMPSGSIHPPQAKSRAGSSHLTVANLH